MAVIVPCNTCQYFMWASPSGTQVCNHPACTSQVVNYALGSETDAYLSIDEARSADGPCLPSAKLWRAIPDARRSY